MLNQVDLERLAQVGTHLSLGRLGSESELIQTVFDALQETLDAQMVGMVLLATTPDLYYTGQQMPPDREQRQLEHRIQEILESLQVLGTDKKSYHHHPILGRTSWSYPDLEEFIGLPLVVEGRITGLLFAARGAEQTAFQAMDLTTLAMLCGQLSVTWLALHLNRQLAEQNQQLQALNQYREEFIRNLSHDLRTPLTCVLGYAELLHQHGSRLSTEQHSEFLTQILSKAKTLRILIDNLLDFNNGSDRQAILTQIVDLQACLEAAAQDIQSILAEKQQTLVTHIPLLLPQVLGDAPLLIKVLLNLLHNSQKFSPVGSELLLEAHRYDDYIRVCVRDSGPGLNPEALERVFEKFIREPANRPISSSAEGIGLGLAVCKDIIEALKGRIWAENRSEGTAFCFELRMAAL
ncbi:GAF domain-containing sensor histidine kinase [Anthocerotibacter panamensis]|uniref:GAF domain-containing sensor histidine kinase n=1 Tax=Anthocerotibacter panamensis TaxID=2857077 RepID=UPI001C403F1F|nr:ATP-binding protein [Anthocerotibacter panamensis]